jgi:hypothetical protein
MNKIFYGLHPNDVFQFQIEDPPEYINVKVVRGAAPRR